MHLDVNLIKPKGGTMTCVLWENENIDLPLTLFYVIEIPLDPFDSGHRYVDQPCKTALSIEYMVLSSGGQQEKNWKNLDGKEFRITYEDNTGEGSIYLGTEHCQFNTQVKFESLKKRTFDLDLKLEIDFNIDTINLPDDGVLNLKAQVDFQGLILFPPDNLPTFRNGQNSVPIIQKFVDMDAYESCLVDCDNPKLTWKQLKPK